ncbi:MAG: lysine transporter LysE, partial [Bacteroidota bacterium]|nr:lysine transporter LysE [Bacteroidota bacterium]
MIALGFLLGFIGYIPLGNINLTVVQLSIHESVKKVWAYILLASLMEFIYCLGCLEGMEVLLQKPHWVIALKWAAVVIFFLLGVLSFFHKEDPEKKSVISGFGRGVFAAIINPLQIPFWLVWGVYLTQNKWLHGELLSLILFAFVTSLGTISILWLYAVGGKKLVLKLKLERKIMDRVIGLLL